MNWIITKKGGLLCAISVARRAVNKQVGGQLQPLWKGLNIMFNLMADQQTPGLFLKKEMICQHT